ncbi:MAG: 50S ribosomal protein L21 [Polyangia bacterium]|jgi:large subunit ribosomal protein L21
MYAVIQTGGKQYRVAEGETLRVEKLPASPGDKLSFSPLLFADDGGNVHIGKPNVSGIMVEAEVTEQGRGEKIVIFKYKRRKSYRRKTGHRQPFTALKIVSIKAGA